MSAQPASPETHYEVLVPVSGNGAVTFIDNIHAIRAAMVDRGASNTLQASEWDVPGVYLLLGRHDGSGTWGGYVGMASKLKGRIRQHESSNNDWYRALLVKRDNRQGFNTAEAGCLEGLFYDLLTDAEGVRLTNGNRPSDDSLPSYRRDALGRLLPPIERLLFLLGHGQGPLSAQVTSSQHSGQDKQRPKAKRKPNPPRVTAVKLMDLLNANYLQPQLPLSSIHKLRTPHRFAGDGLAEVAPDGTLAVPGTGTGYSMSEAQYVSLQLSEDKGKVSGGWYYWQIAASTECLGDIRFRYLADQWTQEDSERDEHLTMWLQAFSPSAEVVAPPSSAWSDAHPAAAQTVRQWQEWLWERPERGANAGRERVPESATSGPRGHRETIAELLEAGLLQEDELLGLRLGDTLHPATVTPDGKLEVDGLMFGSPSGAAGHATGRPSSGWSMWTTASGATLERLRWDLRARRYAERDGSVSDSYRRERHQVLSRWIDYAHDAQVPPAPGAHNEQVVEAFLGAPGYSEATLTSYRRHLREWFALGFR